MLLIIHNLPARTKYSDVKELIITKCGLKELILDNLQNEGTGMRVTVGVAEEEDAAILVRKINGIYFRGQQLYVEDRRQKKDSEQPYRTSMSQQSQYMMQQSQAQPAYDYNPKVQPTLDMYQPPTNYPLYQPQPMGQTVQNTFMPFGGQQAQPQPILPQYTGALNEFNQQPFAPVAQQNTEPTGFYVRRSPSPRRNSSRESGSKWDEGRLGSADRRPLNPSTALPPWASRDRPPRQPDYQDSHTARSEFPEHSRGFIQANQDIERDDHFSHDDFSRGDHSSNFRESRDGDSTNLRDMRGDHFSNSRDMRGGRSANMRDMRGGHSSNSRDMRGGHSLNSRDMRGGHSSNSRDMRGGHSSNSRDMRGGHSSNSRDMHGDHSSNSRDMRGGHFSNSRDMRGGHFSNSRDMRGGHSSNFRDMRGGYTSQSQVSRGSHAPEARDAAVYAPDMRDNRPKNAEKRRWEETTGQFDKGPTRPEHDTWREQATTQRQSRPLQREFHEPRPKKSVPQPPSTVPGKNVGFAQKPKPGLTPKPEFTSKIGFTPIPGQKVGPCYSSDSSAKALKLSKLKGIGKVMYLVASNLNILPEIEKPTPVKAELRKIIKARVPVLVNREILPTDEIVRRYRHCYPESDDVKIYGSIKQKLAATNRSKQNKATAGQKQFKQNKGSGPQQANKPKKKDPDVKTILNSDQTLRLPKSNKKLHNLLKRQLKTELETLEPSEVSAEFQKPLEEEIDFISALFEKEFGNPQSDAEKLVFSRTDQEKCIEHCKKMVHYYISKRLTDSGVKLVRLIGRPNPPIRADLEEFLAKYRYLSLRKNPRSKFYTATFDSFETVDKLCNMGPIPLSNGQTFVIASYLCTGPPKQKIDFKHAETIRKKYIKSLIETTNVNLLDKDWQIQEEQEKDKTKNNEVTESDNIVICADNNDITDFTDDITDFTKDVTDFTNDVTDFTNDVTDITNDVTDITNDVTDITDDKKNTAPNNEVIEKKSEVSAEASQDKNDFDKENNEEVTEMNSKVSQDNNDFLNVDFKVIDEVRGSDNDEVANDAIDDKEENDFDKIGDDWNETGDDWDDVGGEDIGENDGNASEGDNDNDEKNDDGNIGDIDAADVDWDDVNEDDLEDY